MRAIPKPYLSAPRDLDPDNVKPRRAGLTKTSLTAGAQASYPIMLERTTAHRYERLLYGTGPHQCPR